MKKILLFLSFLLMSIGMWGATSTLNFTASCGGSGTADDGITWAITSDAAESNFDVTKGIHYGTSKVAVSYLNLSTSEISGTITQIVVNASGASGTSAKLNVTVGGFAFGSQQSLTSSASTYTLNGSASGNIIVAITQTSTKKALYCKSITITYTPNTTYTVSFNNFLGKNPSDIKQGTQGGSISLPTNIDICNKCYANNWNFEGWVESLENYEYIYTNTYTPSNNITLYALFSRGLENVYIDEYKLVTENLDDWAGEYLISSYSSTIFADGSIADDKLIPVNPGSNLSGDIVNITWGDSYKITISEIDEGSNTYLAQTGDGVYIYAPSLNSNTNNIQYSNNISTASNHPITITFNSSSNISVVSEYRYLQYNPSAQMFRFYTGGQQPIYLYKRVKTLYPYATEYSTSPECDTAYITTWNTDKIYLDKTLLNITDPQDITIKDINTGEVLLNNSALSYNSDLDAYQVPVNVSSKACNKLNILVKNASDSLYMIYKVPFMVAADSYTTDMINENCDVVVLDNKTLTVSGTSSKNRDLKLYPGAKLKVPTGTTYNLNSLALRRDNNTVSSLALVGDLTLNHLYFDLYIDYKDWYYVALPDEFNISNLRFANGKSATQREDYWIKYYDGKHRAETKSSSWKSAANDTTFMPGCGFIIGIPDDYIKKELIFEFDANRTLINEKSNKTSGNVTAWGITNPTLTPNHKGWNLVGNPYMNIYDTDFASVIRAGELIKDDTSGQWNGHWLVSDTTSSKLRYAVIPSKDPEDAAAGGYKSVVLDERPLDPFICFFVQMGGNNENP